ncbi:MAG: hypothetical protein M1832_000615 [Thelocarpon impressellum]|nr:MAG: hypothetical protein M1832_000615 [Thelocarpon impressellum]
MHLANLTLLFAVLLAASPGALVSAVSTTTLQGPPPAVHHRPTAAPAAAAAQDASQGVVVDDESPDDASLDAATPAQAQLRPDQASSSEAARAKPRFRFTWKGMKVDGDMKAYTQAIDPVELKSALAEFIEKAQKYSRDEQTAVAELNARNLSLVVVPASGRNVTWGKVQDVAGYLPAFYRENNAKFDRTVLANVTDASGQPEYSVAIVGYMEILPPARTASPLNVMALPETNTGPGRELKLSGSVNQERPFPFAGGRDDSRLVYWLKPTLVQYNVIVDLLYEALTRISVMPPQEQVHRFLHHGNGLAIAIQATRHISQYVLYHVVEQALYATLEGRNDDESAQVNTLMGSVVDSGRGSVQIRWEVAVIGSLGTSQWMKAFATECFRNCVAFWKDEL